VFEATQAEYAGSNAQVLGISVDHIPCLRAWSESLGGITFPLLSDFWPHGAVIDTYGILDDDGASMRAIFILDHEGVLRYQNIYEDEDEQPDNDLILSKVREIDTTGVKAKLEREPVELPHGGIVMYCSPYCSDCRQARAWLNEHGITYTEVDVYRVPGASDQVRAWNNDNLVLPTFDVEGEVFSDFDSDQLSSVLRNHRLMQE
jgi:glutaredoxin